MAAQFAPMLLEAGRMAMQYLPYITAAAGAIPGLTEGNLGKAAVGGGLGYFGGRLGRSGIQEGTRRGVAQFSPAAAAMPDTPLGKTSQILERVAQVGIPLAGTAVAVPLIGGLANAAAAPVAGAAKGATRAITGAVGLGRAATSQPGELTPPNYPVGPVPDISAYQYPGLIPQQDPFGATQANLLYQKQLQKMENDNIMRLGNYQLLANDAVRQRDFQRNAAAAQLATNLSTQSQLQLGAQRNAAAMAGQALSDIGATTRTQYNYL